MTSSSESMSRSLPEPDSGSAAHARPPLTRVRMTDEVFALLRDWIRDGTLRPGERLRIHTLARRLGTSATPVREALRELEANGLVVNNAHLGTSVAGLSVDVLHNLYEARGLIEPGAAQLSAPRITDERLEAMRKTFQSLEAAATRHAIDEVLHHDQECLMTLFGAAGNDLLMQTIQSYWDRAQPYKLLYISAEDHQASAILRNYHKELLDACADRNGKRAATLVRRSLVNSEKRLAFLLSE
jgi:DNA-binding GntR family transcriptional regulator